MISKFNKIFISSVGMFLILLPTLVLAQNVVNPGPAPAPTPVPRDVQPQNAIIYVCTGEHGGTGVAGECTFADLIAAVQKIVKWGTIFALEFSVVVIIIAGFKYMTSGDNPGKRSEANKMLRSVAIGIFFILAAWLIVTLILTALKVNVNTFLK